MADFLYKKGVTLLESTHAAFSGSHNPGVDAPYPGMYQCLGCQHIIAIASGHKLPPQNHHTHTAAQGTVRWQLIVTHS